MVFPVLTQGWLAHPLDYNNMLFTPLLFLYLYYNIHYGQISLFLWTLSACLTRFLSTLSIDQFPYFRVPCTKLGSPKMFAELKLVTFDHSFYLILILNKLPVCDYLFWGSLNLFICFYVHFYFPSHHSS